MNEIDLTYNCISRELQLAIDSGTAQAFGAAIAQGASEWRNEIANCATREVANLKAKLEEAEVAVQDVLDNDGGEVFGYTLVPLSRAETLAAQVAGLREEVERLKDCDSVCGPDQNCCYAGDLKVKLAKAEENRGCSVEEHDAQIDRATIAEARAETAERKLREAEGHDCIEATQELRLANDADWRAKIDLFAAQVEKLQEALAERGPCFSVSRDGFKCSGNSTCTHAGKHNHGRRPSDWATEEQGTIATKERRQQWLRAALNEKEGE